MAVETKPLMPKATAVWLIDNTSLSFDQVADFCGMHPLEVKGIADEDVAKGIKGIDPIATGQLTREEIEKAEQDPQYRLSTKMASSKYKMPHIFPKSEKDAALHSGFKASGQAGRDLLVVAQPPGAHRCRCHQADRHDQNDDRQRIRDARTLELSEHQGRRSGHARTVHANRARFRCRRAASRKPRIARKQGEGMRRSKKRPPAFPAKPKKKKPKALRFPKRIISRGDAEMSGLRWRSGFHTVRLPVPRGLRVLRAFRDEILMSVFDR